MINAIKNEFYRNIHEKPFLIIILCSVGLALLTTCLNIKLDNMSHYSENAFDLFLNGTANFSLIIIIVSALFELTIGRDFSEKTVQSTLLKGVSRLHVFGSKLLVNILMGVIVTIIYPFVFAIFMSLTKGSVYFKGIKEYGLSLISYYFIHFFVLVTCICVCFILKGARLSFLVNGVCIGIGSEILFNIFRENALTQNMIRLTPIGYLDILTFSNIEILTMLKIVILSLVWSFILVALTSVYFKKTTL